jgi:cysteine-rich repeat protein
MRRFVVLVVLLVGCRTRLLGEGGVVTVDAGQDAAMDAAPDMAARCGDGVVDSNEECDDGNRDDGDACLTTCKRARCGDGIVRRGVEGCDDGNRVDDDSCRNECKLPTCGDGVVQMGEQCDDLNLDDGDACLTTCLLASCGDGHLRRGVELCDDGNLDETDACLTTCQPARCGDGHVQKGVEMCDDANFTDDDFCDNRCRVPVCGDGKRAGNEECDDGNKDDGDKCLSSCKAARCGDGVIERGFEECDDGPGNGDTLACLSTCRRARCGDGHVFATVEQCDDANPVDTDFCDNACRLPVCGDGKRAGSEQCDLGSANGNQPAFLVSQPSGLRIGTNPIIRAQTSSVFYNYFSASSHTGLEMVGESRIYLYVDSGTGRLSLITTHGIDFDTTGQSQPSSTVQMDITGLPAGAWRIDLADDNGMEYFASSATSAAGRWVFNLNSDGGVLGGLPFPGVWKVTVTPKFMTGLTTWGWVRHDLTRIPMVMTEAITIEAFDQSTQCRTDCTIPRCGDKLLDGGEVCDDGNTTTGDGCAGDCKSLR